MKTLIFTNEFPPNVYGGAGVHVDYLTRELARLIRVEVRHFGNFSSVIENLEVNGYEIEERLFKDCPEEVKSVLSASYRSVIFNTGIMDADICHCHTWYTHLGGILARLVYGLPLILTTHSLEPLRPWKREQLGKAYDFSCWIEKTAIEMADAVIAVSEGMREDIIRLFDVDESKIHVIYNGIDTDEYSHTDSIEGQRRYGIGEDKPYVLFVGRITRQKGIIHLINAIPYIDPDVQIVLCAGAPDTKQIAAEIKEGIDMARKLRKNIFLIGEMLDKRLLISLYSHAAVFCCPSIYEPFGIINLEAMACGIPVVASNTGGIREVVAHGETGFLVSIGQLTGNLSEPSAPVQFSKDIAKYINRLIRNPDLAKRMGEKGRQRAVEIFSWKAIAKKTKDLYSDVLNKQCKK